MYVFGLNVIYTQDSALTSTTLVTMEHGQLHSTSMVSRMMVDLESPQTPQGLWRHEVSTSTFITEKIP